MYKVNSAGDIHNLASIFRESRILLTAIELDIFNTIAKERLTSREVALRIYADERATDRLLNSLVSLDLMKKKNGRFSNSELTAEYLVKGTENYISNLRHWAKLWEGWNDLTEVVKTGNKSQVKDQHSRSGEWLESFIAAMHYRADYQAKIIANLINLSKVKKSLDVGGGSGAFTMGFVNQNPDINGVVFDLPNVIPLTKSYVEKAGLSDRIDFIEGDYHSDDFGSGYDLIFISAVIHINSPEENKKLIKKSFNALNEGGQLVIQDFIMNEDRTEPDFGTLFSLNMLVNTEGGDTYTEGEIGSWLNENGFSNIE